MSSEPGQSDDANFGHGADERGEGTQEKTAEQIRAEVEAEFEQKLEGFLQKNEGYKGLQRAFSKREEQWRSKEAQDKAELAALRSQLEQLNSGMGFVSETLYDALDPESRAKAEKELEKRKQASLQDQIAELRKAITNPAPANDWGWSQQDFEKALADAEAEAMGALKEAVREMGADPGSKELDYGEPGKESFAVRLKKVLASAKALKEKADAKDLDEVRTKVQPPPTRTSGGSSIGRDEDGEDLLRLGSRELMAEMRRATPRVAHRRQ